VFEIGLGNSRQYVLQVEGEGSLAAKLLSSESTGTRMRKTGNPNCSPGSRTGSPARSWSDRRQGWSGT